MNEEKRLNFIIFSPGNGGDYENYIKRRFGERICAGDEYL